MIEGFHLAAPRILLPAARPLRSGTYLALDPLRTVSVSVPGFMGFSTLVGDPAYEGREPLFLSVKAAAALAHANFYGPLEDLVKRNLPPLKSPEDFRLDGEQPAQRWLRGACPVPGCLLKPGHAHGCLTKPEAPEDGARDPEELVGRALRCTGHHPGLTIQCERGMGHDGLHRYGGRSWCRDGEVLKVAAPPSQPWRPGSGIP